MKILKYLLNSSLIKSWTLCFTLSNCLNRSLKTGKKRAATLFPTSSIQAHTRQTNHAISSNNFSLISSSRSSSNFELLIHESLLISKYKPSFNENISSTPLSLFLYFPLPYSCHFMSGHPVSYWLAVYVFQCVNYRSKFVVFLNFVNL